MSVSYHHLQKTNAQVSSPSSLALAGCVGLCRPDPSSQHWPVLARWLLFQRSCFIWSLLQPTKVVMTVLPIQQPRKPKPMASWASCDPDRPLDFKVQALGHEATVPSYWQSLALSPDFSKRHCVCELMVLSTLPSPSSAPFHQLHGAAGMSAPSCFKTSTPIPRWRISQSPLLDPRLVSPALNLWVHSGQAELPQAQPQEHSAAT